MKITRLTAALILGALLLLSAVSCGDDPSAAVSETTAASVDDPDIVTTVEETQFEPDALPDLDLGGQTVTVLYRTEEIDEFWMEAASGDIVEDAVYTSNRNVQERLNVTLAPYTINGSSETDRLKFMSAVSASVLAGDDAFQIVGALTYNLPTMMQEGLFANLIDAPYLDYDKPWWTEGMTTYGTIGGKLYMVSGDASLSLMKRTFCLYFNSTLFETLGIDSPYAMVHDGSWTKENFAAIARSGYSDLNGDGTVDYSDRLGLGVADRNHRNIWLGAFDIETTHQDADGYPTIVFGNDHAIECAEWLNKFLTFEDGSVVFNPNSDAGTDLSIHEAIRGAFREGRMLMITAEFRDADYYRDMTDEYGVLPNPKWNESQDGYYSVARNVYSSFAIPVSVGDLDSVCAVLEAIASENYRTLSPAYYETALKVKYSRDDESAQMYDIIKGGLKFNFGYTYLAVVSMTDPYGNAYMKGDAWSTEFAKNEEKWQNQLAAFIDVIDSLE